jgi:C-terminal processing protease CtpA/Prc
MNKLKFAAVVAAGAAFALSPTYVAAQAPATPVNMGIQLQPHAEGAEVANLTPDGTAAGMGLKVGDVITQVDGKPISREVVQEHAQRVKVGDQISFKVKRAGAVMDLTGKALAAPAGASVPTAQPQG